MSTFRKPLALIFSLSIFLFSFLALIPKSIHAEENTLVDMIANFPKNNPWSLTKDFCDKRSGDLMNLETWYSGKCGKDTYTLSGEGVGFVDIIQLQALEWLFTPQYKSLPEQMIDLIDTLKSLSNPSSPQTYLDNIEKIETSDINKGIIPQLALVTKKIVTTKPASTTEYLAYISNNLQKNHITTDAYAATPGYGFTALSPILPLWRAFRNIAYMLFAIGFVLYGIMIMFRVRIDSKTAATIQLAIPKLISTLILITFSYAIVGLLVDISTIAGALLIDVLRVGGFIDSSHFLIKTVSGNTLGGFGSFVVNFITSLLVSPFLVFNLLIGGISGVVVSVIGILASMATGIGIVITVVIFLAVGWSYVKLTLKLFECYFSIIISLMFSPIILLGNILPGSKAFSGWIMNLVGNLAVFPVTAFILTLSYVLMMQPLVGLFGGGDDSFLGVKNLSSFSTIWTPPLTLPTHLDASANTNPVVGNVLGSLMIATIGLGLLLMASKYADMVLEALKVPPFKYGAAIGEALKYGYNQVGDKESSFRKSRAGVVADFAEGQYSGSIGKVTGREMFEDASGMFGKPKGSGP